MRLRTCSSPSNVHGRRTACALIVMPRSRSMSILSRYCARMCRESTSPVRSSIRSANVDLPWSMWAMMQKFRMRAGSVDTHHGRMSETGTGPVAAGVRVAYDALPQAVHEWVETALASPVVQAQTQPGGFSPGVAARLVCADGSRAFVKAVSAETNEKSPDMHRREGDVPDGLPPHALGGRRHRGVAGPRAGAPAAGVVRRRHLGRPPARGRRRPAPGAALAAG